MGCISCRRVLTIIALSFLSITLYRFVFFFNAHLFSVSALYICFLLSLLPSLFLFSRFPSFLARSRSSSNPVQKSSLFFAEYSDDDSVVDITESIMVRQKQLSTLGCVELVVRIIGDASVTGIASTTKAGGGGALNAFDSNATTVREQRSALDVTQEMEVLSSSLDLAIALLLGGNEGERTLHYLQKHSLPFPPSPTHMVRLSRFLVFFIVLCFFFSLFFFLFFNNYFRL